MDPCSDTAAPSAAWVSAARSSTARSSNCRGLPGREGPARYPKEHEERITALVETVAAAVSAVGVVAAVGHDLAAAGPELAGVIFQLARRAGPGPAGTGLLRTRSATSSLLER